MLLDWIAALFLLRESRTLAGDQDLFQGALDKLFESQKRLLPQEAEHNEQQKIAEQQALAAEDEIAKQQEKEASAVAEINKLEEAGGHAGPE